MHKFLPSLFVFLDKFNNQIFKNNNTDIGIIYRNYNNSNKEKELIKIAKECKKKRFKLFVSNNIKLAIKVKANGIYIPAFNRTKRFSNHEKRDLTILGSAHNQNEIQQKISQKCSAIFLSPVFYVKKKKKYLDIYKFNSLARSNKINFFALGGISKNNIIKLKLLHIKGFGGIGAFKKKPALKRPVFLKNIFSL
tara:strand:+ start:70 stop:651 length:582 start_codon:yes stop_codon:yes gene_type:complete